MPRPSKNRFKLAVAAGFVLDRTVRSHGWFDLAPFSWDAERQALSFAVDLGDEVADVDVRSTAGVDAALDVTFSAGSEPEVRSAVVDVLRLDEDLGPARACLARVPRLQALLAAGGGRMLRAPTVFEDVVKMILTTNCSWALTRAMTTRLVDSAGRQAPSGRRAFPTAAALARRPLGFFRDRVKSGYRAPFLRTLARRVATGDLILDDLRGRSVQAAAARTRLLSIDGVGPYAADALLRLLGHHDHLALDSWCRSRYRELFPRTRAEGAALDRVIDRRYAPLSPYRGLALWLDLTAKWFEPAATWP